MKLAIIDIIGIPYDGTTVFKQGLGGSESAVILVSRELAQLGFEVTVFNNCNIDHAQLGTYDGVTYLPLTELAKDHTFDIVISSRTVIPFTSPERYPELRDGRAMPFQNYNLYDRILAKAKMRVLWMHDTFCLGDNLIEELAVSNRITDIFTLSDFHLTYVANCHHGKRRNFEVLKRKFFITRNGVRIYNKQVDITKKDRDLFVYNASVTKGMVPLVKQIWPHVKRHIPTAKLKIIGGYYRFSQSSEPDQQEKDWHVMANDPALAQLGIEFTGVIPQHEIANILTSANFMIYPAAFPETFGISSLESLCYNTPIITCRFGALEEIAVEGACYLIDYAIEPNNLFPEISVPHQVEEFVKTTVEAYRNPYLHQQKQYYCNIVKDVAGWDSVALQWKQHFYKNTGRYLSKDEYRTVSKINHRIHKIYGRKFHNYLELENYKPGNEQMIRIITPMYNAGAYIEQCINSVITQDYDRYHMYIIDDASSDNGYDIAKQYESDHITVIKNTENKGAVRNQIETIRQFCNNSDIVILLDGDDSLVNDNTIFSYYNNLYDGTTEFTYGSCWSMVDNIPLISQPYPEHIKQARAYRQHKFNWILPYTHLRTFKKYLINKLPDSLFQDAEGRWFKAGGDGATFYNIIEQADPNKVKCLQDVVYNYNDASPTNDYKVNGDEQNKNAAFIANQHSPKLKYSVVVPTMWRANDIFLPFLDKLLGCDFVDEIFLFDNAPDRTPILPVNDKLTIIDVGRNQFVNPTWNQGVEMSRNKRICIMNDDVAFDLRLFDVLYDRLSESEGVFGLNPGESDFDQTPITTKTIDIVPWAPGKHTYGFGCLMFIHKDSWIKIPDGLDIYFGDNFIFDMMLRQGKKNYFIENMDFTTPFATTTSDKKITDGFLERERVIYNQVMSAPQTKETNMQKKRILIAIPTARNIEPETFKSIYDLKVPDNCQTTFQYFYGYNIDQVRNLIADWVVKGYDYLFSVDSDISFPPDTLIKLLRHDKDVVSGLYIQRKPGIHVLEVYEHNQHGGVSNIPYEKIKNRGLVEIAGCGFGCALIKAEVMRSIGYPQFEYHSAIDHKHTISEDVDFCRKARDRGFKIWADTEVQCDHTGSFTFKVDNAIPAVAQTLTIQQSVPAPIDMTARLREISNARLFPQAHVNYLEQLKAQGFNPRVIYDIGACVLHWTNEAKKIWPSAEIVAFEAMPEVEFLFKEAGLKYHIGLLSDETGKDVSFYQNTYDPGGNSYYIENPEINNDAPKYFNESHKRIMKSVTLDAVANLKKFPQPDLIKMDVQGAELDIIKGASNLLKRTKHVILELQAVEYNKGAPLKDEVIAYMESIGFESKGLFCNNGPDGDYHFIRR